MRALLRTTMPVFLLVCGCGASEGDSETRTDPTEPSTTSSITSTTSTPSTTSTSTTSTSTTIPTTGTSTTITTEPPDAFPLLPAVPLHTEGRWILDAEGKAVKGSYEKDGKYSPQDRNSYIGPQPVLKSFMEMQKQAKSVKG